METTIATLFKEFEDGKMTRRQLIQSLAVGENFKSFHVLDPDGWDLQISNQTKLG